MNIAIRKYAYYPDSIEMQNGMNADWIAEVAEMDQTLTLPEGEGWEVWTKEQLDQYLIDNAWMTATYDEWVASQNPVIEIVEEPPL